MVNYLSLVNLLTCQLLSLNLMNIILIHTDQQRRDSLPCYGNTLVRTPNIDRLAERGTVFSNAFTTTPICGPARASILTGKFPLRHGIVRNPESGSVAGRDFTGEHVLFNQVLSEKGYVCHHVGKWHVGRSMTPENAGDCQDTHSPGA